MATVMVSTAVLPAGTSMMGRLTVVQVDRPLAVCRGADEGALGDGGRGRVDGRAEFGSGGVGHLDAPVDDRTRCQVVHNVLAGSRIVRRVGRHVKQPHSDAARAGNARRARADRARGARVLNGRGRGGFCGPGRRREGTGGADIRRPRRTGSIGRFQLRMATTPSA
jgi:hypothetical protein